MPFIASRRGSWGEAARRPRTSSRLRAGGARDTRLAVVEGTAPRPAPPEPLDAIALERALGELPDGYREVLLLHDLEGYTHEEIARHFGIAAGTSKSQLLRARRAMRDALRPKGVARHDG
jgi:DNA-directed RNA polymerase specialized sigma24 family protein